MKYCFYIDKEANHKYDTYIDVKLPHPINIYDDEYIKIKVIDCVYLNNMYNISGLLQNNIINLLTTPYTYVDTTQMDLLEDIYDTTLSVITYRPTTVLSYDTANDIQFITSSKYKVHYKDSQIIDGVDSFDNIFFSYSTATELKFNEYENYIIIELLNDANTDYLRQVTYSLKKTTTDTLTEDVTFRLVIQGSHDNITYTTIPYMDTDAELITFDIASVQGDIISKFNIHLVNRIDYKYYKFYLDGSLTNVSNLLNGFKLANLNLFSWPQIPYTTGTELTTNLVIPDGFYKASSYISKISELFSPYNLSIVLNSTTNKVNITQNLVDNIKYPYTDPNGGISLDFPTANIRHNIGINTQTNILTPNTTFISDTNIDLINFKKIILTTNLEFQNKTHNEFIGGNTEETGLGNILFWINNDYAPFTCIKYYNNEEVSYRINDNQINNIRFDIYNEKRQKLPLDNMLIHFEIEKVRL
jgi:hypothetical protein